VVLLLKCSELLAFVKQLFELSNELVVFVISLFTLRELWNKSKKKKKKKRFKPKSKKRKH